VGLRAGLLYSAPPKAGTKEGHGKAVGYLALFSEIGIVLFVTTLGGALAGRWLDQQLGTYPFILVAGFILGVVLGALADWRLVDRFLKSMKDT
jgi:F0F1-type ATP synthase assembly protein I